MKRVAVALFVLLAACGSKSNNASTTTTTTPFRTTEVSTPENSPQALVTRVQVGAHDGFTRVVFEFGSAVPGYSVKVAQPPFVEDGSGATVVVPGVGHIAVRLIGVAHDAQGNTSYAAGITSAGGVTQVVRTGDFEGVVGFIIGTKNAPSFRVLTLASPPRLVVDIAA